MRGPGHLLVGVIMDSAERWLKKNDPLYGKKEAGYLTSDTMKYRQRREINISSLRHMARKINLSDDDVYCVETMFQ